MAQPFAALGDAAGISEAMTLKSSAGCATASSSASASSSATRNWATRPTPCVWNLPDDRVAELGRRLAAAADVTLCYRRERALPHWPYNLYCMIHGNDRETVRPPRRARRGTGTGSFPCRAGSACAVSSNAVRYAQRLAHGLSAGAPVALMRWTAIVNAHRAIFRSARGPTRRRRQPWARSGNLLPVGRPARPAC